MTALNYIFIFEICLQGEYPTTVICTSICHSHSRVAIVITQEFGNCSLLCCFRRECASFSSSAWAVSDYDELKDNTMIHGIILKCKQKLYICSQHELLRKSKSTYVYITIQSGNKVQFFNPHLKSKSVVFLQNQYE